jgi:predicted RNA-binding protein Jag
MDNIKKYIESYLLKLGFNDQNAFNATQELMTYALQDTYAKLLDEEKLKVLVQAMIDKDEAKILEINKDIPAQEFNAAFIENIKHNLSLFVQEMITQMPAQYHEQMEEKLKGLNMELNNAAE